MEAVFHESKRTVIRNTVNEGNAWLPNKEYLETEKKNKTEQKKRIHLPMHETLIPSLGQEDPL